jgi:NADP-dependent 3-hydroxy acid dehydrogenase YdfG
MAKTTLVCGYGPGISSAVAKKFGAEGFSVALVARSKETLAVGAAALEAAGIKARAFPADLTNPEAVKKLVADVRRDLGPITVIHWNAYAATGGDLMTATAADLRVPFDVSVTGLVMAVQSALPDLKEQKDSAVLVTGGAFAFYDPNIDAMAVQWASMGVAIGKAAQHKAVALLAEKLKGQVYVGEVVVAGTVKGTRFDSGKATLEAADIANQFWQLYRERSRPTVTFG